MIKLAGLIVLMLMMIARSASASAVPKSTLPYGISDFVENASGTVIYGADPAGNSVVEINPVTLKTTLIPVGTNPTGLALSADGNRLYVADQGTTSIDVLNTQTNALLAPIAMPNGNTTFASTNPLDVQVGTNNRLWVLTGSQNNFSAIEQIDATTGALTGSSLGIYSSPSVFAYGGRIRTSPDGKSLYYGDYGTSPSYEYQLNVSGTTPAVLWSASLGGNGEDVTLSRDGSLVAFGEGGNPTNNVYSTSTDAIVGAIGSGENIAFSPDDVFAYASNQFQGGIYVTSLTTFTQTSTISTVGSPQELFVDDTGQYLFSDEGSNTQVYATGRVIVPEPGSVALIGLVIFWVAALAKRRAC